MALSLDIRIGGSKLNAIEPVFPVVPASSDFNSRLELSYFERDRSSVSSQIVTGPEL